MNPIFYGLIQLGVVFGIGFFFFSIRIVGEHGEFLRPVIGKILRKKRIIRRSMDTESLFAAANLRNGKRKVQTHRELNESYYAMKAYVKKNSWYRIQDLLLLEAHYVMLHDAITRMEARQRTQQNGPKYGSNGKSKSSSNSSSSYVAEWRKILGVAQSCSDAKVIKNNYRKLVSKDHPDKGGKGTMMPAYNRALAEARNELNFV